MRTGTKIKPRRAISRNDAVVAAAEGDRELPQRALQKLRLAHSPTGAGQDGQLIQHLVGGLAHAPVGLMRQGYHPVHIGTCTVVIPVLLIIPDLFHVCEPSVVAPVSLQREAVVDICS